MKKSFYCLVGKRFLLKPSFLLVLHLCFPYSCSQTVNFSVDEILTSSNFSLDLSSPSGNFSPDQTSSPINVSLDQTSRSSNFHLENSSSSRNFSLNEESLSRNSSLDQTSHVKNFSLDQTSTSSNFPSDDSSSSKKFSLEVTSPPRNFSFDETSPPTNISLNQISTSSSFHSEDSLLSRNSSLDETSPPVNIILDVALPPANISLYQTSPFSNFSSVDSSLSRNFNVDETSSFINSSLYETSPSINVRLEEILPSKRSSINEGQINKNDFNSSEGNFLSDTHLQNLTAGQVHVDLNSDFIEKFNFAGKFPGKTILNDSLEGDETRISYNEQGFYSNRWWSNVDKEITELLPFLSDCKQRKYKCFKSESKNTKYAKYLRRVCDCDESCDAFGECCVDKAATMPEHEKINFKNRMYCSSLSKQNTKGIYMIGNCLPWMKGTIEEELCHQKVEIESYGVILDIPILSMETNFTYINYYCAVCNNDSDSLLQMDFTLSCNTEHLPGEDGNMTLDEFLKEAKYKPRERIYERSLPPSTPPSEGEESNEEGSEDPFDGRRNDSARGTRAVHRLNISKPLRNQICQVEVSQYKDVEQYATLYGSRTCASPIIQCSQKEESTSMDCTKQITSCDSSWPDFSDFEKCQLYSMKVYDRSKNILYKNPHCAKCNFANFSADHLTCADLRTYVKKTLLKGTFSPRKPTFSILFQIPNRSPRKCPKRHEIWNPFDNQCTKIICGVGRVLREGKCVQHKYENYETNIPELSFLIRNCPTVPVSDFTLYENSSVFVFTTNKYYEKGDYELFNNSIILLCAQDNFYYKKFFLFSYYTTVAVLSISLVCLAFHITLYFCYSRLRTWHGRNLLFLCFSLFVAQFLFLTGTTATKNFGFCVFMSVCIHYFWLASFFWMNVLSIDVWRTFKTKFSHNSNTKKVFLLYNLYSWGVPFIIVMLSLTLDLISENTKYKPIYAGYEEAELCWINNKIGLLCFFLLPVAMIISENLMLFTITSYKIYSQSKETRFAQIKSQSIKQFRKDKLSEAEKRRLKKQEKAAKNNKIRFVLYLKLAILQGLTWVFGFLASYINSSVFWYVFTILNGLQGAYIVLCFDIKKWVFASVWRNLSIVSISSKLSKSTKTTPYDNNDSPKDEIVARVSEKVEKKSSYKKIANSFHKSKHSEIGSSPLRNSSLRFKSFKKSHNECVSSDAGIITSEGKNSYNENSKTFDFTEDTFMKDTDAGALKSCR